MSLFIDFLRYDNIIIEVVKEFGIADLAVQSKYNVKSPPCWVLHKQKKSGNIAEITFVSGFNRPSCFTKYFFEKFRYTPA